MSSVGSQNSFSFRRAVSRPSPCSTVFEKVMRFVVDFESSANTTLICHSKRFSGRKTSSPRPDYFFWDTIGQTTVSLFRQIKIVFLPDARQTLRQAKPLGSLPATNRSVAAPQQVAAESTVLLFAPKQNFRVLRPQLANRILRNTDLGRGP